MRWHLAVALALVVVSLGASQVQGQPLPPTGYSPYLNLVRPGSPGMNYYGLVRPELEFRNNLQQLQRNTTRLQTEFSQATGGDLSTGHPSAFMYFGGYYSGIGRGGLQNRNLPNTTPTRPSLPPVGGYRR
ncbi:MAG: hypothetical protein L0241_02390 [Planctomycetia bacterium]|nr:hypothetical protein [Planctomycetia bacterium]